MSFRGRLVQNLLGDGRDLVGGYFLLPDASGRTLSGLLQISEPETENVSDTP